MIAEVYDAVVGRANGQCEHCNAPGGEVHHRLMRSQGGTDTEANCVLLCVECHRQVHSSPAWAYDEGLLIRSYQGHPAEVYKRRPPDSSPW